MSKSKLLTKKAITLGNLTVTAAIEDESVVMPESLTSEVMEYAWHHREDIYASDKKVPETFDDLRPDDALDIDPAYFLVPDGISYSKSVRGPGPIPPELQAERELAEGNYRIFVKRYAEVDGVHPIKGLNPENFAVAIRISAITAPMLDDLLVLDTPVEGSQGEEEEVEVGEGARPATDAAWEEWAYYDFIRALEGRFPELVDTVGESQARALFERVQRRSGVEWIDDEGTPFIDVEQLAAGVKEDDFER